jgi:APA family basic amino acid/polyamine antiporter
VVAGFALGNGSFEHLHPLVAGAGDVPAGRLGLALSPILFSYLGWNAPVFVGSEIHTPGRTIPRALFLGLAICTGLYLAVNVVYLYALPIDALRAAPRAGDAAARALFGPLGGTLVALVVLASVASCLHATILVGPRIAYAMALDGLFFRGVQHVHPVRGTPHVAIVQQAAIAIAVVLLLRRFRSVLDYTTFAIVLATMADTGALYALRRRRPRQPRPYRAWGYPFVPALYLVANAGIAFAMLRGRPLECLAALAVPLGALPFWVLFRRRRFV